MSTGGGIEFEVGFGTSPKATPRGPEQPFKIAILGNFCGKPTTPSDERRLLRVDRDNLATVLGKLRPQLGLRLDAKDSAEVDLVFERLEDFHPDRIYRSTPLFQRLRVLRDELENPATLEQAMQALRDSGPAGPESTAAIAKTDSSRDLVAELLADRHQNQRKAEKKAGIDLEATVQDLVRRHVRADVTDEQERYLASIDTAIAAEMRTLLHHPDFQDLEARWRALDGLVRSLETDAQLQVFLCAVSKEELRADLVAPEGVQRGRLYRQLVDETVGLAGGSPWSLIVGDYTFDDTAADAELLGAIAELAQSADAAVLAGASPGLAGCRSLGKYPDPDDWDLARDPDGLAAWQALRKRPGAERIGLVLPRVLQRLPYGAKSEPTESFRFEEIEGTPRHADYLWGNPAYRVAGLLGTAFAEDGWGFQSSAHRGLHGLPIHTYRYQGETVMKPPTEAWLTDRAARVLLAQGLMPLTGAKNTDRAQLVAWASLADPPQHLRGPWT